MSEEKRLSAIVCEEAPYSIVILLFQWRIDSCRSSQWSRPTLHDSEATQTESDQSIGACTFAIWSLLPSASELINVIISKLGIRYTEAGCTVFFLGVGNSSVKE